MKFYVVFYMKSSPNKWLKTIVNALRNGAGTVYQFLQTLAICIWLNQLVMQARWRRLPLVCMHQGWWYLALSDRVAKV